MARFFAKPSDWRKWLTKNHAKVDELWVGFYKRKTSKPSITWPESVDEALCFGSIDGKRQSIDDGRYQIRFTPRKAGSNWSLINIRRVAELEELGLMHEAGRAAFAKRQSEKSALYSYEQRKNATLEPAQEKKLRANRKAWAYFQNEAPWYQRAATHWIVSAKKEETREKRLRELIEESAEGRRIKPLLGRKA